MCPTLCNLMDCSLPASFIHGIFQARILEWVAISFPRASSRPRDQTLASHTAGRLKCLQMSYLSFLFSFSVKQIIRCILCGCFHSHKPWVVACSSVWPNVSLYLVVSWSILNVGKSIEILILVNIFMTLKCFICVLWSSLDRSSLREREKFYMSINLALCIPISLSIFISISIYNISIYTYSSIYISLF